MESKVPNQQPEPFNVMDETRWVSREAVALAREGGDVDRRATFFARKARLMAELARIASTEGDEHDHVEQSKTRARESFARRHDEDADLVEGGLDRSRRRPALDPDAPLPGLAPRRPRVRRVPLTRGAGCAVRIDGCPAWCGLTEADHAAQVLGEDKLTTGGLAPDLLEDALAIMYEGDVPPRRTARLEGLVHKATWADDERRWWVDAGVATDSQGRLEDLPSLIVGCDHLGITTDEARLLAAAILEAADALDATEVLG